jgi:hypothetical protein
MGHPDRSIERQQRAKIVSEGETIEALRGSILKWEQIASGVRHDNGSRDCPLCAVFMKPNMPTAEQCRGCPVSKASGMQHCENTPYAEWLAHFDKVVGRQIHGSRRATNRPAKAIALKEVAFLRSLLPPMERQQSLLPKRKQPVGTTTVNEAIALLERARTQVGGDACLILSLTGSGIEMVGIDVLVIQKENESRYVEVRARLPKGYKSHE